MLVGNRRCLLDQGTLDGRSGLVERMELVEEQASLGDVVSGPSTAGNGSSLAVPVISRAVHRAASRSASWRHSLAGSILAQR